jgi:hypothetical protein
MIAKQNFYDKVKADLFGGKLKQSQVDGMNAILDYWDMEGHTDLRWLAYMLATTFHETAKTMQPIEEYGKGGSRPYGKKIKQSGKPYTTPDKIYYGRGFVQLTWYENYEKMGKLLKLDLLQNPELVLTLNVSTSIIFEGMLKADSNVGDFTGKCLEQYFNATTEDWVNARRIINGTDKAEAIAEYGKKFYAALK